MRRAVALSALICLVLTLLGGPAAHAEDAGEKVVETVLSIEGTPEPNEGPVSLDVTVLTTDPDTPRPAVVLAHGFGGTKDDSLETARILARSGYAVIVYTARGFGASGGRIHLDHPQFEGADAVKIIDLAVQRAEVTKIDGDPVIGFAGASYGGALALLAAGLDRRVDATVPAFTWNRLNQALFPQHQVVGAATSLAEVVPTGGPGVFKQRWAALLFSGAGTRSGPPGDDPLCGRFTAELCAEYRNAAETGRPSQELTALLEETGPDPVLDAVTAPTLIIAGEDDTLFPPDQADANLRGLPPQTPARLAWVAGGHDAELSTEAIVEKMADWFDHYLKRDGSTADTSFSVVMPETFLVGDGDGPRDPETLSGPAYPGRGADRTDQLIALAGDQQSVIAPPGGAPAALSNLPGTGQALNGAAGIAGYALAVLPGQSALFTTEPLAEPLTLVGSPRVHLEVTSTRSTATLFASLWDLGPDIERNLNGRTTTGPSTAILPQLAVAPVRLTGLTPGEPTSVTIALPAVSHQVPLDHRLQLVISSTDQAYALPAESAVYQISLGDDRMLAVPQLELTPVDASVLDVPLALVIVVGLLIAAAVAGMILFRRRQRAAAPNPELVAVPLVVDGVVKTYRGGVKAVDGVSFRAEAGQVVGLLGPNGAGKTTVIRMLVGLIRPDAGEIFVHGEPVHGGADVLASVGAFIEGPGFLPHLTGRQNLLAYWAATGRPQPDAHLEEALAIAGLGSALDRKVRGYSHGMRQRLGIAQAMLGLPSLLVLDEPTNGLDPPQIKAMRAVLADYAAAGRTVVISSHLLSEVEQTCSHVVVMDQGKVILTGSVAELTADDAVSVTADLPREQLVDRLQHDGYRVVAGDGQHRLEEVFMSLVGASGPGPEDRSFKPGPEDRSFKPGPEDGDV